MVHYCEKCRDFHETNDMCPKYKEQLREHPEWLAEAADFANVAAQERLVSTQALDGICRTVEITTVSFNKTPLLEFLEEMRGLC